MPDPITVDAEIMHGLPCFTGTRVKVKTLFDYLAAGDSVATFLKHFPSVKPDQVQAVLTLSRQRVLGAA